MADPRLNSLHLEPARRQDYRRARDVLLNARGVQTICASVEDPARDLGHTIIQKDGASEPGSLDCWLTDGDSIYPLKIGVNTAGRASENDVVIEDPYASRRHCAFLVHADDICEVHDTASKNGTFVNGARLVRPRTLRSGDEIRISNQQFIFQTRHGHLDSPSPPATLSG
jgi:hypothetical protein